jgi:hypothetical protein
MALCYTCKPVENTKNKIEKKHLARYACPVYLLNQNLENSSLVITTPSRHTINVESYDLLYAVFHRFLSENS